MSKAIAFLAGLGVGHMDEKRRLERQAKDDEREARQRKREDTADARATEVYDFQKGERQRAVDQRTALERAATPDAVVPEATMPETMDARDIGAPGEAPVPVTGYKVGAARFASQGLAQDAAVQQANQRVSQVMDIQDPAGRQKRQTEALQGKAAQVQLSAGELQLKEAAGKAMKEGVLEALQAAAGGASPEQVAAIYNRNGEKKVAGLKVEPFEFDHPTLGKQRSARISGTFEDGTPLQVQDAFSSSLDLFGAAKKFDLLGQWARDKDNKDARLRDDKRADEALALQKQGVQAQRAQLGMQMAAFKMQQKAAEADARIPPAVKMQHALYGKELDQIGSAMAKSMAEGSFDPAGKGTQELMLRQRELTAKSSTLLQPYLGGGAAPAGGKDPLGLFAAPPPAAGAPAQQRSAAPAGAARMAAAGVQPPISPQQLAIFDKMPDAELAQYVKAGNEIATEVARRRAAVPVQVPAGMFQN
jgi:hypothetical protein